jgi:hypothetical protein
MIADIRKARRFLPLLGGLASVLLRHMGFMGFFFLVPLGLTALLSGFRGALAACFAALILESAFAAAVFWGEGGGAAEILPGLLYAALVMGVFVWIMSPPGAVRTARRFMAGAAAVTALFLFMAGGLFYGGEFRAMFRPQAEFLSSLYAASSEGDAVRRSVMEEFFTADHILDILDMLVKRGGALGSSMILFFVSRRLSFFAARVAGSGFRSETLPGFHAPPETIWILSFSLLGILFFRMVSFGIGETAAWNAMVLSAIVFFAQGGGIVLWFLSRKSFSPVLRVLVYIGFLFVLLSPVINAFAMGLLVLLGIAENWAPLRASEGDRHLLR